MYKFGYFLLYVQYIIFISATQIASVLPSFLVAATAQVQQSFNYMIGKMRKSKQDNGTQESWIGREIEEKEGPVGRNQRQGKNQDFAECKEKIKDSHMMCNRQKQRPFTDLRLFFFSHSCYNSINDPFTDSLLS